MILLNKDKIINLYKKGLSSQQIGPLFNVSWATINRRLKRWGITIRYQYPIWNKGLTKDTDERVRKSSEKSSRMSGHIHTLEARLKMSESQKGKNIWSKGKQLTSTTRKKMSQAIKKRWQDPEYRVRISQMMKERWADPEYANRVRPLIIKANSKKPTRPERQLIKLIKKYNLPFKYTGDGSFSICGFNPDFVNSNGAKTVIEVFGDYWHSEKKVRSWKETELGRIMAYNSFGFKCIILWEKELNTLPEKLILERIR